MRNERMQIHQSLIAPYLSKMAHDFLAHDFLNGFSVSFNMIFSENLGNNLMFV